MGLKQAAYWAELSKYGRAQTQGRLGNILLEMLRMTGAVDGQMPAELSPGQLNSFVLYSAHYPTILGALAALEFAEHNPEVLHARVPEYASALILELYLDRENQHEAYFVRLLYKDGDEDTSGTYLSLGERCSASAYCPFELFSARLQTQIGFDDDQGWCKACGNTVTDVCKLQAYEQELQRGYIAIGCLGSAALILATLLGVLLLSRRFRGAAKPPQLSEQASADGQQTSQKGDLATAAGFGACEASSTHGGRGHCADASQAV